MEHDVEEVVQELAGPTEEAGQGFPLSPQQRRLWSLLQGDGGLAFRAWCVVEIAGDVEPGRLEAAVKAVVARHEILRTTFHQPPELAVPLQRIGTAAGSLAGPSPLAQEELAERLRTAPLDLAAGPTLHAELATVAPGRLLLGLALPALCADAVSLENLVREIAQACDAGLPDEPALQYADVAEWLRGLLEEEGLEAERYFWQRAAEAAARTARLPFARPGAAPSPFVPRRLPVPLPAGAEERLADLAAAQGTVLPVVLLACWQALLLRLTGSGEVTAGVLFDGRQYEGLDVALGLFARVLPVHMEAADGPFAGFLSQVDAAVREAQDAQDGFAGGKLGAYPYAFDFAELPEPAAGEAGWRIVEQSACHDRAEIQLRCVQGSSGLALALEYDEGVFDRGDVAHLAERFGLVVAAVLADPEVRIADLALLTGEESRPLAGEPHGGAPAAGWVHERFERQAERDPGAPAAVFDGAELSYGELDARANRLAHALQRRGVGPDVRVALLLGRAPEMLVGLLATLKAGGAFVPLDPAQPAERLGAMLADLGAAVVLTERGPAAALVAGGRAAAGPAAVLALDADWETEIAGESAARPAVRVAGENLAYVIFTSGSTGRPKGVGVEHRQLANYVESVVERLDLPAAASYGLVSTFAADLGHTMIFPALCLGGTLRIASERQLADPELLAEALDGVDCLKIVPSHLEGLLAACSRPARLLPRQRLVLGGEACRQPLLARVRDLAPGCRICNHYGPTETTVGVLTFPVPAGWEAGEASVLPLGRPLAGIRLQVLDRRQRPAPFWVGGELHVGGIGGAGVARGYLGNPAATAEKFVPDPWGPPGERLYRTGDLVRRRPDGILEFLGRIDDQVKIRGNRVEPGEIAAALGQHPAVEQAVVVAREETLGEPRLVAYWVAARGGSLAPPDARDLRAFLAGRLPAYMVPTAFVQLAALPLTANGKLDRRALPAPPEDAAAAGLTPPRTPTEEILAGIWSEVLGRERIGVTQNFFDLGGHSLLATQVVSRVRKTFGIDLALRSLLESPSVAGLAQTVDHAVRSGQLWQAPAIEPVDHAGSPPLSFAQQRLWFLDQLDPESAAYNLPGALRLLGPLDVAVFRASLSEVVRRHESLRATFATVAGKPVQRIAPPAAVPLPAVDLAGLAAAAREREARRLVRREAERPFDLARGPLLRATLLVLGGEEHALLLTCHHVVSDGWSRGILTGELGTLYTAFSAGRPSPLPELPIQYGDFAHWQRSWLAGEVLEAEIAYWRERLGEAPPPLELPSDRPRSALHTRRAGQQGWSLPGPLLAEVQHFARQHGATAFMVLLSGFQGLLGRYTGQEDIAVGSPIAGRNQLQTEGLIGFFVNTLVLRTGLGGDPDAVGLVQRVREVTLGAYAHQDVPFEQLVAELSPERDLAHTPFFPVVFALQNAPARALELPGLTLEPLPAASGEAKFDLTWMLYDGPDGVSGVIEHNRDLFDGTTVSRMLAHFDHLLGGMVAAPGTPLSELPLLAADERMQIVREWNDTADAALPAGDCLHQLFEAQAARSPGAVAVAWPGGELTYGELDGQANQLAHHLADRGAGAGDRVAVYLERSPEMIVAVLGILKTGATYVPLDANYPEARVAWILRALGARHVVTAAPQLPALERIVGETAVAEVVALTPEPPAPAGAGRVRLLGGQARLWPRTEIDPLPTSALPPRSDADDVAYIIFTSGTTGTPKGVVVCHRPAVNLIQWVNRTFAVGPADRLLFLTSLCFDLSVYDIFGVLGSGGSVRVTSEAEGQDPAHLLQILLAEPITFWDSAPAALQQLVPFLPEPGSVAGTGHLRLVFLSGDWIPVTLPDRVRGLFPRARVIALGGATEAAIWSNFHPVGVVHPLWASIPYGRPISNARYHVLDGRLAPCPIGVTGDLYIGGMGGSCLFTGYAQEPVLTAGKLLPDPAGEEPGARLYRTGDRARYWPDGTLEFLGRADHQVKIRGFRVELGEIEATLSQHPALRSAVAIVREDRPGDRRLVAYVVAEPGREVPAAELREFVKERLPAYMVPSAFIALPNLPVTANGKLDRKALPAPVVVQDDEAGAAPSTPEERLLAEIWSEVLGLERVTVDSNFFELGGDSILSIQVSAQAGQAGLHFTPRQLFEAPTIRSLAALATPEAPEASALFAGLLAGDGEGGPVPLTPIESWFFDQDLVRPEHFNQALFLELVPPPGTRERAGALLAAGLDAVAAHHAALSLRFSPSASGWQQEIGQRPAVRFSEVDLTAPPPGSTLPQVMAALQSSLGLAAGPLLRAALLRTAAGDRLLLVAHHLVVDGVSWRVLLEDLETAYRQLAQGEPVRLAPSPVSFQIWAERLAALAVTPEREREAAWWLETLGSRPAGPTLELPAAAGENLVGSAVSFTLSLTPDETRALLQDAPRAYRTQINDLLLAALVEGFGTLTGVRRLVVDLEGHGRDVVDDLDVSRTVGWLTNLYPVALDLEGTAGPGGAIRAVKEQLRAVPARGGAFGLLRYLGRGEVAERIRNLPRAAVLFNYLGQLDGVVAEGRLFRSAGPETGPARDPRQARYHLLEINAAVSVGQLHVTFAYSRNRHRPETVERLAANFAASLRRLIAHCLERGAGGFTPSDFPLAGLDGEALDRLVAATPGAIEDVYPASSVQRGMLFHALQSPGSGVYVGQFGLDLGSDLVVEVFQEAWRRLLDRHAILRTAFYGLERPLQVVRRVVAPEWALLDWRELPAAERRERREELLAADRRRGFDAGTAPLCRFTLIDLGSEGYHFIWTLLFVLVDGWSMQILLRELFALYQAGLAGRKAELPPVRPYRDYIAWLSQQDLAMAEAFWRRTLAGFTSPTPLSLLLREPLLGEGRQDTRHVALSAAATEAVRGFARRCQVTVNTVVQGAWALLLGRHSGEEDVVFGAVTAGRSAPLPGIDAIVGLFINTLPVRASLPPEAPLGTWLAALHESQTAARQFEYSPLAEVQGWSAVPRGQRLFDSILIFENFPVDDAVRQEAGQTLGMGETEMLEQTNFPLSLFVHAGVQLSVKALYGADRIAGPDVSRLLAELQTLLSAMESDPGRPLSTLPLLTAAEAQQVAVEWNDTVVDFGRSASLSALIAEQVARTSEAVAVSGEGGQLSYGELARRAGLLARRLRRLGVGPDVPVGIAAERSPELMVGLLGILTVGGAYVPLDPSYPAERLSFMVSDALQGSVLLTQTALAPRLANEGLTVILLDSEPDESLAAGETLPAQPDQLAYVTYTSGSTGRPKGSMNTHRAISNRLLWMQDAYLLDAGDRVLQKTPLSFDVSVWELFWPLLTGACLVMARPEGHKDSGYLVEAIAREGVTTLHFVPSMLQVFVEEPGVARCTSLRRVFASGEALPRELVGRFFELLPHAALHNLYGPTEAAVDVSYHACTAVDAQRGVPIGRPIANLELHLSGSGGAAVPVGAPGELLIGGVGLSRGYLDRPELTAERFVPHAGGTRLYRTGDLARLRADGEIEYLGRLDHQVKIRGMRVELGEIESVLAEQPGVREAVAVVQREAAGGLGLVAFVTALTGARVTVEGLRAALARRLPEALVPAVAVLEALPLTPNGKVDRSELASRSPRPRVLPRGLGAAPRTPLEELLADLFATVLRIERPGIEDSFFALGGHSLLATQLVSRVREACQIELPLRALFDAPSVARLAVEVERMWRSAGAQSSPAIPPIRALERTEREGALPLSFAQERLWFLAQLDPRSAAYNLSAALRLSGDLKVPVLAASLTTIRSRHGSLRTTFRERDGGEEGPFQVVSAPAAQPLPLVDLGALPAAFREPAVRSLAGLEAGRPFDLERGPVVRSLLLRLEGREHVLLLNLHHIVADGWSIGVVVRELAAAYSAWSAGSAPDREALSELPVQYVDYAVWQRRWLAGEVLARQIAWWQERLTGLPDCLDLPTDFPRPKVASQRGDAVAVVLSPALGEAARRLAGGRGATLFMVLLSALSAHLSRLCDEDRVAVGSPVANRNRLETEELIGFFVNTLVLPVDLSADPTFFALLRQVRETTLGAYAHQEVPFEKLVEVLAPRRSLAHSPLFQVMLTLNNAPRTPLTLPGLALESLELDAVAEKFDFSLTLSESRDGRLQGSLTFATDLFERTTADRFVRWFGVLLAGVVAEPGRQVSALHLLAPEEVAEIVAEVAGPATRPSPETGRPLSGERAYVLDARLQPCPPGVPGELFLGGGSLDLEDLGPDLTAERFVPDLHSGLPGERLYRTGDRVRYRQIGGVGELAFLGRMDQRVKVRGRRLASSEADAALAEGDVTRSAGPREGLAARTPTEEVVAGFFCELLALEQAGRGESFFDLGGHSLLATRLASRLRAALKIELTVSSIFESPTIAGLARRVDQALQSGEAGNTLPIRPPISRFRRDLPLPLSFAQQRLWFLDQLEPASAAYNLPLAVTLEGALDPGALAAALRETVRRHESLRTTFAMSGEPVQVVASELGAAAKLAVVDLRHLPPGHRRGAAETVGAAEARRPFDLSRGPLLRVSLLALADEEHVLLLTMHHIASDGWSMSLLVGELAALYTAYRDGRPSPFPDLAVQYPDFAAWQRGWLAGEVLGREVAYWRRQLVGAPPTLDLPTDRPRPARQTYAGARHRFQLPGELGRAVEKLARGQGATRFMVLLAAFEALLSRWSGQSDLSLGTPISGRNQVEVEPLIGFFVNTLVLRTDTAAPSFAALLERVRATTLGAFAHQELPFERLVEELHPERDLARTPLFQVLFVLDVPLLPPAFPGLAVLPFGAESGTAKFDLSLGIAETAGEEGGLSGVLEYRRDLFDPPAIRRLAGHLETLLAGAVREPGRPLPALPLLTPAEAQQAMIEWNDTAVEHGRSASLDTLIAGQAGRTPEAVAVVGEGGHLSYGELARRAGLLARSLRRLGVGPDVPVGIAAERSLELMVGLLGILEAGGAYVPLDPGYPAERLSFMAKDALRGSVLLTQAAHAPRFANDGLTLILLDAPGERLDVADSLEPALPEQLAYVIYTSGSTGRPKGSMNTHRAIANRLLWMQDAYGLDARDRVLQKTPLSFDVSVWELFWPLLAGACLVMARPEGHKDSGYLAGAIAREAVTTLHFVPSMLQVFVEEPEAARCSSLCRVFASGEALSRELVGRFFERLPGAALHNLYGPTEAAVDVSFHACTVDDARRGVPIGRPIANLELHLAGADGGAVPVGAPGELRIGGVGLSRGYLNRPELTAERFVPRAGGGRLYRTGDLARFRPDGEIEYLGRLDHQVKIRGLRVELGEIESILVEQPGVREAVALAREEATGGLGLAAFVTARSGETVTVESLRAALGRRLPEALVPGSLLVLDALPLTPNGKLDRAALLETAQAAARQASPPPAAPRTPVEELLADLFASVLRVERVGIEASFFELGGHSLLATQVMSRVRAAFSVELPLSTLFEAPNVARLAARVEAARRSAEALPAAPPILPLPRDGRPLALSFAQQRLWFLDQLQPGRADYNLPSALHLRGELDVPTLAAALTEIVRRHESLRTTFETVADTPVQVIGPPRRVEIPVLDLSGLGETLEAEVRLRVEREARRPFALAVGPLLRATLLAVRPAEHVLVLNLHHIVGDAWSLGVLVRELREVYRALVAGRPSPLPEPALQYADFAGWQRRWLAGEVLAAELAYWRRRLAGVPPVLELPTDRPQPAVQTFPGANFRFAFSPEMSREIQTFSRERGATLFMTLLAAFQAFLTRYSGQEDLALGTPIAGRNRLETENLIGFFVNTLVLRTDLSGDPAFSSLLARVRETTLADFAHQDLPFEKLVEELQPARQLNHAPFFQVALVLQNAPVEALGTPELRIAALPVENVTSRFDMTLFVAEEDGRLIAQLEHNTDLFDLATVERLAHGWTTLLRAAVGAADPRLSDLPLLTAAELAQLAGEWNPEPGPAVWDGPVHRRFARRAAADPGAPAVLCGGAVWSYGEIQERAESLAKRLRSLGVGPEVLVGLAVAPSSDMIVGILGILAAGGAYLPLDPSYPAERLRFLLEDSGAALVVAQEGLGERLAPFGRRLVTLDGMNGEPAAAAPSRAPEIAPENAAYVIYTSGSTGTPKGVTVTHGGLANFTAGLLRLLDLVPGDRMLQFASISFDASVLQILPTLAAGAALVLDPEVRSLSAREIAALCERTGVTVLDLPAGLWRQWVADRLADPELPAASIRLYLTGGEAVPATALYDWAARVPEEAGFFISYGPTEATVTTTAFQLRAGQVPASRRAEIPLGLPLDRTRVHLLDPWSNPVPAGVPGEVHIGGAGVTRGYLHRPDLTAERFVPDPWSPEPGARLYKTGDLARYHHRDLQFLGRRDGQVKLRGFRVELGEIEAAVAAFPGVRECAALVRDLAGDRRVVAYVVPQPEGKVDAEALRAALAERLPAPLVPSAFVELPALPRLPSGKLDRRSLPEPEALATGLADDHLAPRTPLEAELAAIWADVLGLPEVGVHGDFFALGGHSLLATQVVSRASRSLGREIPLRLLFEARTIARLAEELTSAAATRPAGETIEPIAPAAAEGDLASLLEQLEQLEALP